MAYNPIKSVNGHTVRCPSKYRCDRFDVSKDNAGRTADSTMHKCTISTKVKLELGWQNISSSDMSDILTKFEEKEYFDVEYLDAKAGRYLTKEFYVGDRSAPMYNCRLGIWSNVEFNIIER